MLITVANFATVTASGLHVDISSLVAIAGPATTTSITPNKFMEFAAIKWASFEHSWLTTPECSHLLLPA